MKRKAPDEVIEDILVLAETNFMRITGLEVSQGAYDYLVALCKYTDHQQRSIPPPGPKKLVYSGPGGEVTITKAE